MRDFMDNLVPLSLIALCAFFLYGAGHLVLEDMAQGQLRYEQCLAADKQWIKGSCVE